MRPSHSELRQDLVSGDWIVIAPARSRRGRQWKNLRRRAHPSRRGCPFEDPEESAHKTAIFTYGERGRWALELIENKFPAFTHREHCSTMQKNGPYTVTGGVGHHDLVITKNHDNDFPALSPRAAYQVFQAFRDRYLMLLNDECVAYVSIFHNWGPTAGASIYHPHYQMISIPVVPPDVEHSLQGSKRFYRKEKACVHCRMFAQELRIKKRIIFENKGAVALTPFVSRTPFEVRVFPKAHLPYFENSYDHSFIDVVEALQESLRRMKRFLGDPDYNFFIHTAPIAKKKTYEHYHWHIEILPKLNIFAGFELGTGLEINPVDPDKAAVVLRRRA